MRQVHAQLQCCATDRRFLLMLPTACAHPTLVAAHSEAAQANAQALQSSSLCTTGTCWRVSALSPDANQVRRVKFGPIDSWAPAPTAYRPCRRRCLSPCSPLSLINPDSL